MTTPTEPLQFEIAEDASLDAPAVGNAREVRCLSCATPLTSYFDINGKTACERCKDAFVAFDSRPHLMTLLKAAVFGFGGAVVGAGLFYAIAALTGYQLGLVSIVVGLLVGFAVRRGSGQRGGWRYQALAVGLTYLAICSTYLPFIFKEVASREEAKANAAAAAGQTVPPEPKEQVTLPRFLGAVGMLIGFTLVLPFLGGADNIMGLIIIAIALWEAWKVNREVPLVISGPLAVGARTNG